MTPEIKNRIDQIRREKVPEGWNLVSLGSLGMAKNGLNYDRESSGFVFKILGVGDFKDKSTLTDVSSLQTVSLSARPENDYFLKDGDIVFVRSNGSRELVGRNLLVYPRKNLVTYSGFCIRLRLIPGVNTTPEYINLFLDNGALKRQLKKENQGTNINNLNQDILRKLAVLLPPIKEQQKIAEILTAQDKIIELKEKLIAEKQQYKKYLMQQLLTGNIRLPGFTGEWKTFRLSELLRERKSFSPKGNQYPHVTLSSEGIYPKSERYDRDHLVKSDDKEYKITHKGDICYNPANLKFGAICTNNFGDAIFSPIYITFEVLEGVDLGYLSNYLMRWNFINAVRKYEEGTVYERMAVKPDDFLKFEITLPATLVEQSAISKILSVADQEISLLQQSLEQEKQKKKALMQLLLTGIVRVNV